MRETTMRKVAVGTMLAIALAAAVSQSSSRVVGAADTQVTAAGVGLFPDGATFNGIPLDGSTFGFGLRVFPDGSARGNLVIVLAGTSLLGKPQEITLDGYVDAGITNPDGSVSFSGTGTLDTGDGTPPAPGISYSVTVTDTGLQLTIGTSVLPTQNVGVDDIFIGS
jgi:hypothetical protein